MTTGTGLPAPVGDLVVDVGQPVPARGQHQPCQPPLVYVELGIISRRTESAIPSDG